MDRSVLSAISKIHLPLDKVQYWTYTAKSPILDFNFCFTTTAIHTKGIFMDRKIKELNAKLNQIAKRLDEQPTTKFEQAFFDGIKDFAFYDDLNVACQRISGKDIPGLMEDGNYKAVVSALLEPAGLNYGALPKGLLKFHKYPEGSRTPMEEHLAEGALYAAGKSGKVNVHFHQFYPVNQRLLRKMLTFVPLPQEVWLLQEPCLPMQWV